jgi:hypothetical protein
VERQFPARGIACDRSTSSFFRTSFSATGESEKRGIPFAEVDAKLIAPLLRLGGACRRWVDCLEVLRQVKEQPARLVYRWRPRTEGRSATIVIALWNLKTQLEQLHNGCITTDPNGVCDAKRTTLLWTLAQHPGATASSQALR